MDVSNSTTNYIKDNKLERSIFVMTVYTIFGVMSLVSNGVVIICAYYVHNRSCGTKICANISLSNILASVVVLPIHGQGDAWLLRERMCLVIQVVTTTWRVSILFLTLLAVLESYKRMLRHYRKRHTAGTDKIWTDTKIIIAWMCACAIGLFSFFFTFIKPSRPLCVLYQHSYPALVQAYFSFIVLIFLIMLGIAICYMWLVRKQIKIENVYRTDPSPPEDSNEDLIFCRCGLLLFYAIFILWLPYIVYILYLSAWGEIYLNRTSYTTLKVLQVISFLSSLVQPSVTMRHNVQMGHFFRRLFVGRSLHNTNTRVAPADGDISPPEGSRRNSNPDVWGISTPPAL